MSTERTIAESDAIVCADVSDEIDERALVRVVVCSHVILENNVRSGREWL